LSTKRTLRSQRNVHPERRVAWLLIPGWNILWVRLRHDWAQPVFEWLGGKEGVRPDVVLAARRTWRAVGWLPRLTRIKILRGMTNLQAAKFCVLWPMPQLRCEDLWYRWALSIPELIHLNLEVRALGKRCAKTRLLPASDPNSSNGTQASRRARLGIVAHLHYLVLWPEIRAGLRRLPPDARLLLTISDGALPSADITTQTIMAEMAAEWPDAFVQIWPNRGRDVGPFMRFLEEGRFDGLDCVCKIHGKRSLRDGRQALFGDVWRQYAIETLLPCTDSIELIGRYFTTNPQLGILGPARLRLPRHDLASALDSGHDLLRELMLSRFDRDFSNRLVFFAGTMFWFRPDALKLLKHPPTGGWAFAPEPAPAEGSLAHALERLLPTSALLAGYSVESLSDTERIRPDLGSHIKPD